MSKPVLPHCRLSPRSARPLFLLILLTGCETSNNADANKPKLPDEPPGLLACTVETVPALPGDRGTGWSNSQVDGIIGDQRTSALSKLRCANDWQQFYLDLKKRLAG